MKAEMQGVGAALEDECRNGLFCEHAHVRCVAAHMDFHVLLCLQKLCRTRLVNNSSMSTLMCAAEVRTRTPRAASFAGSANEGEDQRLTCRV